MHGGWGEGRCWGVGGIGGLGDWRGAIIGDIFHVIFLREISPVSEVYPTQNNSNCPCADIPFCSNTTCSWYNL